MNAVAKIKTLIESANAYFATEPKMALVYVEQAWNAALEANLPVLAADLQNTYYDVKRVAFG